MALNEGYKESIEDKISRLNSDYLKVYSNEGNSQLAKNIKRQIELLKTQVSRKNMDTMADGGMIYIYNERDYTPNELIAYASSSSSTPIMNVRDAIQHLGQANVAIKGLGKHKEFRVGVFEEGGSIADKYEAEILTIPPQYGWRVEKINDREYDLYNRLNKKVAVVKIKGDKYTIFDAYENKLLAGRGQMGKSLEKLLDNFFYAKRNMASGGLVQEDDINEMIWFLKNEGNQSFDSPENSAIADELVNRGLAEKYGNLYGLTRKGEQQIMQEGGQTMNNKSTCNCPTMDYHKRLSETQKEKLGGKYLSEGGTITDKKMNLASDITAIQHNGIMLKPQSSFSGAPREEFLVPFEELIDKHDKSQIEIGGFENTEPDHKILILVVKDIMSANIIKAKDEELNKLKEQLQEAENNIEEDVEVAEAMAHGGVIGEVRASKAGVVKEIRDIHGKLLKEVYAGDKLYRRNPVYKTYNSLNNDILFKQDIGKLRLKHGEATKIKNKRLQLGGSTFETGTDSPKVNNLILFADNTKNLAEIRDAVYELWVNRISKGATPTIEEIASKFKTFLVKAIAQYIRELGNTPEAKEEVDLTSEEKKDFQNIYALEFPNWLKEKYGKYVPEKVKEYLSTLFNIQLDNGGSIQGDMDKVRAIKYWGELNQKEKLHFLMDHSDYVFDKPLTKLDIKEFTNYKKLASATWNSLPAEVQLAVEEHVIQGLYEEGGNLAGYESKNSEEVNKLIGDDIQKTIKGIIVLLDCTEDPEERERLQQQLKEYDYNAN